MRLVKLPGLYAGYVWSLVILDQSQSTRVTCRRLLELIARKRQIVFFFKLRQSFYFPGLQQAAPSRMVLTSTA